MYAPMKQGDQPSVEVSKEFMMSPNKLHLEASLDKELYYHGETVAVNVHIQNNSNKSVKKIKVSIRQFADICLFSTAQYKCTVAEVESEPQSWAMKNVLLISSSVCWLPPLHSKPNYHWLKYSKAT
ncbi:Arrestin red cell isoform 3 [Portunus trituberculatus]|uniref:Arrestin red cell isoform 3 n=1 Tax=Portunus trituberculatus TaxID=210409 RepID=A0A5B7DYH5_PORTR|nr:Arrestin red cell isoform 3 [Portunus trituberculatus]